MKIKKMIFIAAGILVGGTIIACSTLTKVNTGYVGLVYSPSGGLQEKVLNQGWHFVSPFNRVSEYTVATEQAYMSADGREGSREDDSFMIPTSDGKMVRSSIEFSYKFDESDIVKLFTKFRGRNGEDIETSYMRGKIKSYIAEVSAQFNVLDIYGAKRAELNSQVFKHVREKFANDGIIIESFNFIEIQLDERTAVMIQQRVDAQQALETQRLEKEKVQIAIEKDTLRAKGGTGD